MGFNMGFIYLKPCPFCGNDQLSLARDPYREAASTFMFVVCPSCGTRGPVAYRNNLSEDALKVAALRRWEERADG